ncbi:TonB-dependent receptor [Cytophagaceae bacterium ABcell3]|nr:TonB-dependent receptor [Cytophagaceae bacterium ABcell3]
MNLLKQALILILALGAINTYGQVASDSLLLEEVVVEGDRFDQFTGGNRIEKVDSATLQNYRNQSIADVLAAETNIFIKSQGPGNLATTSMRGGGASHTAVLWNGFNIQAPTLGQIDFSLVPVSFLEDVNVQYGGAGALWGSGAVGGTIHLRNRGRFNKGITVGTSARIGSFGHFHKDISAGYSNNRYAGSVKAFYTTAVNNYPYYNTAREGNPLERQTNAAFQNFGVLQENYFRISKDQELNFRIWLQSNNREVPPTMTAESNTSELNSQFGRFTAEWRKTGTRVNYFIRSAYFNETTFYYDTLADINSETNFQSLINEAEAHIKVADNHLFNLGINNSYHTAQSTGGYPEGVEQNRLAFFSSYRIRNKANTWSGDASVRQEFVENITAPIVPAAGFRGRLLPWLKLKGNVARTYRIPTFNDLYWQPGGNPDLVPESGWSQEAGIVTHKTFTNTKAEAGLTAFNSNIDNMIIWLPTGNFWSPKNVRSVWSRGLEVNAKIAGKLNNIGYTISSGYNYVVATNEETTSPADRSLGKQLIYVPMYNALFNIELRYRDFQLRYNHNFTGNRFITTDNSQILQSYHLANLFIGKRFKKGKIIYDLHAQIHNLWNVSYQVMQWQAMPLRSYQAGISINFTQK